MRIAPPGRIDRRAKATLAVWRSRSKDAVSRGRVERRLSFLAAVNKKQIAEELGIMPRIGCFVDEGFFSSRAWRRERDARRSGRNRR